MGVAQDPLEPADGLGDFALSSAIGFLFDRRMGIGQRGRRGQAAGHSGTDQLSTR